MGVQRILEKILRVSSEGDRLHASRYIDSLLDELSPLPASLAFVMREGGVDTVKGTDDIETIALRVIVTLSLIAPMA